MYCTSALAWAPLQEIREANTAGSQGRVTVVLVMDCSRVNK